MSTPHSTATLPINRVTVPLTDDCQARALRAVMAQVSRVARAWLAKVPDAAHSFALFLKTTPPLARLPLLIQGGELCRQRSAATRPVARTTAFVVRGFSVVRTAPAEYSSA